MKKIISLMLSLLLIMNIGMFTIHAESLNEIESVATPDYVAEYAKDVVNQHFYSVTQDVEAFGFKNEDLTSYKLGNSFTLYNTIDETILYEFALLSNNEIVGLLEVYDDGSELTSSLAKSFGEELNTLLSNNSGITYKLITDGNNVYAISEDNETILLYTLIPDNSDKLNISYINVYNNQENLVLSNLNTIRSNAQTLYSSIITRADVNRPISYKTLNVKGQSQYKETCWAATCAALINYLKGTNLTYYSVSSYIHPSNPYIGGTDSETIKAYNHWGVSATKQSVLSFSTIKSKINSNKPIHLILTSSSVGHAVGLIGYEDWEDRNIIIIVEPNGGVRKSIQLKSNGNFSYTLSPYTFTWNRTIVLS